MYEIDALFAGLLGGFIGGLTMVGVMYFNYQSRLREYLFAKEGLRTRRDVEKIREDIQHLRIQMAAINAESYHSVVEHEYK